MKHVHKQKQLYIIRNANYYDDDDDDGDEKQPLFPVIIHQICKVLPN